VARFSRHSVDTNKFQREHFKTIAGNQ